MSEVCAEKQTLKGELSYFGIDSFPTKNTVRDDLCDRSNELFRDIYFVLIEYFKPLFSVSGLKRHHLISYTPLIRQL
ncbi:hypothetical protein D0T51_11295 [Parabacteroides sp. 52]|nr:hypothetical protein [Parabacteroides sp. 52]